MKVVQRIVHLYTGLLRLYPRPFRAQFEQEMPEVFAAVVDEARERGITHLIVACFRELRDLPVTLLCEHWSHLRKKECLTNHVPVSENAIRCPHCGYTGPTDARYCARCGCALLPLRLRGAAYRLIDRMPALSISLLGLLALVHLGFLAGNMIFQRLSSPISYVLLISIFGLGSAYIGWHSGRMASNRKRLNQVLWVSIVIAVLLAFTLLIDQPSLQWLVAGSNRIAFGVPGILQIDASERISSESGLAHLFTYRAMAFSAPLCGLAAVAYVLLTTAAGSLVSTAWTKQRLARG